MASKAGVSWHHTTSVAGLPAIHQQNPLVGGQAYNGNKSDNNTLFSSSLQSHRSRVFARRSSALTGNRRTDSLNHKPQPITRYDTGLISAPDKIRVIPGRVSVGQFPNIFFTADCNNLDGHGSKITLSKIQHGSRRRQKKVTPGVAGMSSKEAGTHHLKSDKMAMGWAEIRAAQTIPNLRDSQELDRSADHENKQSTEEHLAVEQHHKQDSPENHKSTSNLPTIKPTTKKPITNGASNPNSTTHTVIAGKHNQQKKQYDSKLSSGYGSLSSSSPRADEIPKHPIFRPGDSHSEPALPEKEREMVGIYSSVVHVEDIANKSQLKKINKNHILNEKEAHIYRDLQEAYRKTAEHDKQKRKELFFRKLQDVQIDSALHHNRQLTEQASKKEQTRRRQQEQLHHIRSKFEEERARRFKTQYVTKNFLSYEKKDRADYGLPDQHMRNTEYHATIRRSGGEKVTALAFVKRQVKLKKSYSKMFTDPKTGKKSKDPKMEGVDQVTLEVEDSQGGKKKSRINVKEEIKRATKLVQDVDRGEIDASDSKYVAEPSLPRVQQRHSEKEQAKPKTIQSNHTKPLHTEPKDSVKEPNRTTKSITTKSKIASKASIDNDKKQNSGVGTSNKKNETNLTHSKTHEAPSLLASTAGKTSTGSSRALADTVSVNSRISVITEESEDEDFYDKLMAKYGIELSDDDDDD